MAPSIRIVAPFRMGFKTMDSTSLRKLPAARPCDWDGDLPGGRGAQGRAPPVTMADRASICIRNTVWNCAALLGVGMDYIWSFPLRPRSVSRLAFPRNFLGLKPFQRRLDLPGPRIEKSSAPLIWRRPSPKSPPAPFASKCCAYLVLVEPPYRADPIGNRIPDNCANGLLHVLKAGRENHEIARPSATVSHEQAFGHETVGIFKLNQTDFLLHD